MQGLSFIGAAVHLCRNIRPFFRCRREQHTKPPAAKENGHNKGAQNMPRKKKRLHFRIFPQSSALFAAAAAPTAAFRRLRAAPANPKGCRPPRKFRRNNFCSKSTSSARRSPLRRSALRPLCSLPRPAGDSQKKLPLSQEAQPPARYILRQSALPRRS